MKKLKGNLEETPTQVSELKPVIRLVFGNVVFVAVFILFDFVLFKTAKSFSVEYFFKLVFVIGIYNYFLFRRLYKTTKSKSLVGEIISWKRNEKDNG